MTRSWSQRKAAVKAEAQEEQRAQARADEAAYEAEIAEKSDEELLEELGLPDPDTLDQGDDFKVFLTDKVPARIRKKALRKLWTTNPVFANVDGLVDYGEDFTDASAVMENLQTAYQVGKGMTAHVEELARKASIDDEQDVQPIVDEEDEEAPVMAAIDNDDGPQAPKEQLHEVSDTLAVDLDDEQGDAQPVTRRMRFSFSDGGQVA